MAGSDDSTCSWEFVDRSGTSEDESASTSSDSRADANTPSSTMHIHIHVHKHYLKEKANRASQENQINMPNIKTVVVPGQQGPKSIQVVFQRFKCCRAHHAVNEGLENRAWETLRRSNASLDLEGGSNSDMDSGLQDPAAASTS